MMTIMTRLGVGLGFGKPRGLKGVTNFKPDETNACNAE